MNPDLLKVFLIEVPKNLGFDDFKGLQHYITKVLFYSATDEGKYLKTLFPRISPEDFDPSTVYNIPSSTEVLNPFYEVSGSKYSHPPDEACAKPFQPGDPVYRCDECGFDSTCVLCASCFNKEDHLNHNVTVYTSSGTSGGICDCGDPEAFIRPLNCKCQTNRDELEEDVSGMMDALQKTIQIAIDYVLDVSNFTIMTLPLIHTELNEQYPKLNIRELSDYLSLPEESYSGASDVNSTNRWALILWNDEFHNLTEAVTAIKAGTGVDDRNAYKIAEKIDIKGFCVLKEDDNPQKLIQAKRLVESNGLVATIVSARDLLREKIASSIIDWIIAISNSSNSQVRKAAQSYFAELLLEPHFRFSKVISSSVFQETLASKSTQDQFLAYFKNGLPYNGELISFNYHQLRATANQISLYEPISSLLDLTRSTERLKGSRLQYLLAFQIRFPKLTRQKLGTLLVPPLVTTSTLKREFANQFVELFPALLTIMGLTDREEDLNLMSDITSQLFTCPQTVRSILDKGGVKNLLGPLAKLIEEHSTTRDTNTGYRLYCEIGSDSQQKRAIKKAIVHGIYNLSYFSNHGLSGDSITKFLQPDHFSLLVLMLRYFQSYWPVTRKYGEHVERDDFDLSVHVEISLPILKCVKNLGVDMPRNKEIPTVVAQLIELLSKKKNEFIEPGVIKFQVSKEPVAIVNPLNSLLSYFLQFQNIDNFKHLLQQNQSELVNFTDISLRSIVLGSQVKAGFWIRNGSSVSRQATAYFDSLMTEYAFMRDFHLNQIAILFEDQEKVLMNFLERWELRSWFKNEVDFDKTIYEERFFSIVERFIAFAYNLFVDRSMFINETPEDATLRKLNHAIGYALCEEAMAFSELHQYIDTNIASSSKFEDVLYEVADYQPPSALTDSGLYRLKESTYEKLDPLNILVDPGKFQIISEMVVKNSSKQKKRKSENLIVTPVIEKAGNDFVDENIGNFAKSLPFVKLIYKLMQVSIDTSDETYLPHLLHLVHAIMLDDEMIHGKEYLNKHFVDIPITDLLLTILESTMSKYVCQKADYLVEQLVGKDKRIIDSLVDCFGEDYIQRYKKRKNSLFESDAERKKRKAEKRKNNIFKKFSKQREKFLNQNQEFQLDIPQDSNIPMEGEDSRKLRTCVACGELESFEKPLAIMAASTKAPVFWKVPVQTGEVVSNAFKTWDKNILLDYKDTEYGVGYDPVSRLSLDSNRFESYVLSTCGHSIHHSCLNRRIIGSAQYSCPLCHNLHDMIILTLLGNRDSNIPAEVFNGSPNHLKYNQIVESADPNRKLGYLLDVFFKPEYFDAPSKTVTMASLGEAPLNHFKNQKYLPPGINSSYGIIFNRLMNWTVVLADTIRMNEISTRLNGVDGYSDFLSQIPGSAKTLLICMFQMRVLNAASSLLPLLADESNTFQSEFKLFWNSNLILDGVFNEVLVLFFQTDESLATLTRVGMSKLIAIAIKSLTARHEKDNLYLKCIDVDNGNQVSDVSLERFHRLFTGVMHGNDCEIPEVDKSISLIIYCAIERILGIFLRQVIIFKDTLTCKQTGENNYESIPELLDLQKKIKLQDRLTDTKPLTDALGVPSFDELIETLLESSDALEGNVFDIIWLAKIPKYHDKGILTLEYPGIVHLVNLPVDYNSCVLNASQIATRDNSKCLICGQWINASRNVAHMLNCSSQIGILFISKSNMLRICVYIGTSPITIELPAPYLTKHGEIKVIDKRGRATLSGLRFAYLNKLWVTQGLYGFVTRNLFGSGFALEDDVTFNFERNIPDLSEDDDGIGLFEWVD